MKTHNNVKQGTDEWLHLRKGKITGTTLKALMGTTRARQDAVYDVIADSIRVGVDSDYENPMDRGTRLEPEAIAAFEFETGKKVDRTGLCQKDEDDKIANSPDGLIGETEAIEVKCMGGKNHIKLWITNEVPDDYYWQVVQYFVVNEKLEKLYFVGYNPDIPSHSLHIIEVNRETLSEDIEQAILVERAFIQEVEGHLQTIIKI